MRKITSRHERTHVEARKDLPQLMWFDRPCVLSIDVFEREAKLFPVDPDLLSQLWRMHVDQVEV